MRARATGVCFYEPYAQMRGIILMATSMDEFEVEDPILGAGLLDDEEELDEDDELPEGEIEEEVEEADEM